jgi:uncharacterized repeat protein (TIGR03803 family)
MILPAFGAESVIHSFVGTDGQTPVYVYALSVSLNGYVMYGTTNTSATNAGVVFKVTKLGVFSVIASSFSPGFHPSSPVVDNGNGALYGITQDGGGVIYKLTQSGGVWTTTIVYSSLAGHPQGQLVYLTCSSGSHPCLFGTTKDGGAHGDGSVWQYDLHTNSFSTLYSFANGSDGMAPLGGLTEAPATPPGAPSPAPGDLCGTTSIGGAHTGGTLFCYSFSAGAITTYYSFGTSGDGATPLDAPYMVGEAGGTYAFYGTTLGGGSGSGTVWSYDSGTNTETVLHTMSGGSSDGSYTNAPVSFDGTYLYSTAETGGANGGGIAFKIAPDGTGFSIIYSFPNASTTDGYDPQSPVTMFNGHLYTMTRLGGTGSGSCVPFNRQGCGTVIELQ